MKVDYIGEYLGIIGAIASAIVAGIQTNWFAFTWALLAASWTTVALAYHSEALKK